MSKVEWGNWIIVDGKRPKWLLSSDKIIIRWESGIVSVDGGWDVGGVDRKTDLDENELSWNYVSSIRLPADHWCYKQQPIELNDYDDYQALRDVLDEAYEQAASGKGKDRHANGNAWLNQPIFEIGRMVGVGFNTGQAIKKLQESIRMKPNAAVRELLGAIVYAASAIQLIRETAQHNNETGSAE